MEALTCVERTMQFWFDLFNLLRSLRGSLPFTRTKASDVEANASRTIFINLAPNSNICSGDTIRGRALPKPTTSPSTSPTKFGRQIFLQTIPHVGNGVRAAFMSSISFLSILILTMAKDGYEDWNRHRSDRELNHRKCWLLSGWCNMNATRPEHSLPSRREGEADDSSSESGEPLMSTEEHLRLEKLDSQTRSSTAEDDRWSEIFWKEVRVGDILKLSRDEAVPADLVILATSEDDGLCFAETKNLDGETNLKSRQALKATNLLAKLKQLSTKPMFVKSEPPGVDLYAYNGSLSILERRASRQKPNYHVIGREPISIQNTLLRGCIVRNVSFVIGLVIFTGPESKIVLNSGVTPSKRSYIERLMNEHVIMNFCILLLMSVVVSVLGGVGATREGNFADLFVHDFLPRGSSGARSGVMAFFTCLILFQNIVPVSLYLTVEVVKSVQAYFIHGDLEMYYEPLDTPCVPKAWNLSDDLGQIEYIFSDKTGTLTQNVMVFRQCSIGGIKYGTRVDLPATRAEEDAPGASKTHLVAPAREEEASDDNSSVSSEGLCTSADRLRVMGEERDRMCRNNYRSGPLTFSDHQIYTDLRNHPARAKAIRDFFTVLALCHTVLVDLATEEVGGTCPVFYSAESPDEAALVSAAANVGFTFVSRHQDKVQVDILGKLLTYRILHVLEFSSARKRMSVILQAVGSDEVILFCKGADSVLMERLGPGNDGLMEETLSHLHTFAKEGLRTLCVASRVISRPEYRVWDEKYREAQNSLQGREDRVATLCEEVESGLTLIGGTAIEDKLQEGVPESIALLREAGLKIWVLTGDKVETAINIGYSCNLLSEGMPLMMICGEDPDEVEDQLDRGLGHVQVDGKPQSPELALVIEGSSLRVALQGELRQKLLRLGQRSKAVICCRVSPLQKAQVVNLIGDGLNSLSLAIGDGANDVSMIQAAHIGVGIAGLEGYQAVMASDYAIAQFRFLSRLLLVHGRWSYSRVARMILCFFYKNLVVTLANFWFQFVNGASQNFLFEYLLVLCYNLIFTAFPVMALGSFDQDIRAEVAMVTPQLYRRGIRHEEYTHRRFGWVVLDAAYQSVACFFLPYVLFDAAPFSLGGQSNSSLDGFGTMVVTCVVVTTNLYVGLWAYNWTWVMFAVIGLSILVFFGVLVVMSRFYQPMLSVDLLLFTTPGFWLLLGLVVMVCLLPRLLARYAASLLRPSDVSLIREQVKLFSNYIRRQSRHFRRKRRRQYLHAQLAKTPCAS
ncbi:phospholipid transporting ATPase [Massospora cicadina]|nr:phospholipid transporting ATPase [Massospora cicadina]